jgi:hypothetical protein
MIHLHDELAHLGSELLVLGFQLAFAVGWTIDQGVVVVMNAPSFDDASGYLMIARGLPDGGLAGFDLSDQLTFEFGFELSTNFSHYEYRAPHPRTETIGGREGLWKMPQLWKSTKVAFGNFLLMISTSCLEKPPQKTLRLFHIYHSPGCSCS